VITIRFHAAQVLPRTLTGVRDVTVDVIVDVTLDVTILHEY